jgi:hypothetical protein
MDHLGFGLVEPGKQALQLVGQCRYFIRSRLLTHPRRTVTFRSHRDLRVHVPFRSVVTLALTTDLVHGDLCQQLPKRARLGNRILALRGAPEERAKSRLDNIIGIHAANEAPAHMPFGQMPQSFGISPMEFRRSVLITFSPTSN